MIIESGGVYCYTATNEHYKFLNISERGDKYVIHIINVKSGKENGHYVLFKKDLTMLWKPVFRLKLLHVNRRAF